MSSGSDDKPPVADGARNGLLEEIRRGTSLKPVQDRKLPEAPKANRDLKEALEEEVTRRFPTPSDSDTDKPDPEWEVNSPEDIPITTVNGKSAPHPGVINLANSTGESPVETTTVPISGVTTASSSTEYATALKPAPPPPPMPPSSLFNVAGVSAKGTSTDDGRALPGSHTQSSPTEGKQAKPPVSKKSAEVIAAGEAIIAARAAKSNPTPIGVVTLPDATVGSSSTDRLTQQEELAIELKALRNKGVVTAALDAKAKEALEKRNAESGAELLNKPSVSEKGKPKTLQLGHNPGESDTDSDEVGTSMTREEAIRQPGHSSVQDASVGPMASVPDTSYDGPVGISVSTQTENSPYAQGDRDNPRSIPQSQEHRQAQSQSSAGGDIYWHIKHTPEAQIYPRNNDNINEFNAKRKEISEMVNEHYRASQPLIPVGHSVEMEDGRKVFHIDPPVVEGPIFYPVKDANGNNIPGKFDMLSYKGNPPILNLEESSIAGSGDSSFSSIPKTTREAVRSAHEETLMTREKQQDGPMAEAARLGEDMRRQSFTTPSDPLPPPPLPGSKKHIVIGRG